MVADIQMHPDYLAMVAAESPTPPVYPQAELRAVGAGGLRLVEPFNRDDEAKWLIEECDFRL